MKFLFQIIAIFTFFISCQDSEISGRGTTPPSPDIWDQLLKKYVTPDGFVDYKGFVKEKNHLETYLDLLSENPPDKSTWTEHEQLAYWINAYNAFTVKLIVDHYPVESIQDLHPILRNEAYNSRDLDRQLDEQARQFINDSTRNQITKSQIKISKIFSWFQSDFTKRSTLIEFLNLYTQQKIDPEARVSYMDYDWSLNDLQL